MSSAGAGRRSSRASMPHRSRSRAALAKLPVTRKSRPAGARRRQAAAVRRLQCDAASGKRDAAATMSPGPIFEPEGQGAATSGGAARALFAAGFRAGDLVHNALHLSPDARRLHHGVGRACARLRGHSRRHRQHRAAAPGDRAIPAHGLHRHAGLPEHPARHGREMPARTPRRSSAASSSGAALPASLRQEFDARGVAVLQMLRDGRSRRHRLRKPARAKAWSSTKTCSSRSCGPAPAIRSRTAKSARSSSPRSTRTIR